MLLLHGYPDTLNVFFRLVAELPASWGVLAVDFPGQGRSAPANTTSPEARAQWLCQLLDGFDVARVRVFAHDMGAQAALELALLGRVEALVVSHSLLDAASPCSWSIRVLRASKLYRLALPAFPQLVVSRCLATFVEPGSVPPELEAELRETFANSARLTVAACDDAEAWLSRGLERFASLTTDATLLWTKHAPHFPIDHALAFQRHLPSARLIELDSGGHWLAWSHPRAVVEALAGRQRSSSASPMSTPSGPRT